MKTRREYSSLLLKEEAGGKKGEGGKAAVPGAETLKLAGFTVKPFHHCGKLNLTQMHADFINMIKKVVRGPSAIA